MRTRSLALVTVLVLAACGDPAEPSEPTAQEPSGAPSDLDYSCWGEEPPYTLDPPIAREEVPQDAWDALERIEDSGVQMGSANVEDWDAVFLSEDGVEFLWKQPPGGLPYAQQSFRRNAEGRWQWQGGGECRIKAVPPNDLHVVDWWIPRSPEPSDQVIVVEAMELSCTGGTKRKPEDFVWEVDSDQEQIQIALFVESLDLGAADCQGNPSTRLQIKLDEPIDDRTIVDATKYPPRPAGDKEPF